MTLREQGRKRQLDHGTFALDESLDVFDDPAETLGEVLRLLWGHACPLGVDADQATRSTGSAR
jgi:hypothetical protein